MPGGLIEPELRVAVDKPIIDDCANSCTILTENDHRVANHLAMLSTYVSLKERAFEGSGPVPREAVALFASGINAQIRSVGRLHRHLITNRGHSSTELASILSEVCQSYASVVPNCTIVERLDASCVIGAEALMPVAQLANEAITNAMKYAFRDQRPPEIVVSCRPEAAGGVLVEISDNGTGLDESFDPNLAGGFGLNLMRTLSRQVGGTLTFHSGSEGLRVSLFLPPPAPGAGPR